VLRDSDARHSQRAFENVEAEVTSENTSFTGTCCLHLLMR